MDEAASVGLGMLKVELLKKQDDQARPRSSSVTSVDSRSDPTVMYEVLVTDLDGITTSKRKRYSDFEDLHKKLSQTEGVEDLPAMPKKSVFRKNLFPNGQFMGERHEALARILEAISSQPKALPALRDFVDSRSDRTSLSTFASSRTSEVGSYSQTSTLGLQANLPKEIAEAATNAINVAMALGADDVQEVKARQGNAFFLSASQAAAWIAAPSEKMWSYDMGQRYIDKLKRAADGDEARYYASLLVFKDAFGKTEEVKDAATAVSKETPPPVDETTEQETEAAATQIKETPLLAEETQEEPKTKVEARKKAAAALLRGAKNGELSKILRKAEENATSTPPPRSPTSSLRSSEKRSQSLNTEDDPGTYEIVFEVAVTEGKTSMSREVEDLAAGRIVNVLEVVMLKDESRIRGRIEEPSGWISLVDTSTGARWAKKQADSRKVPTVTNLIDFKECQREMDAARSSDQRKSSRGALCCKRKSKSA